MPQARQPAIKGWCGAPMTSTWRSAPQTEDTEGSSSCTSASEYWGCSNSVAQPTGQPPPGSSRSSAGKPVATTEPPGGLSSSPRHSTAAMPSGRPSTPAARDGPDAGEGMDAGVIHLMILYKNTCNWRSCRCRCIDIGGTGDACVGNSKAGSGRAVALSRWSGGPRTAWRPGRRRCRWRRSAARGALPRGGRRRHRRSRAAGPSAGFPGRRRHRGTAYPPASGMARSHRASSATQSAGRYSARSMKA